MKQPTASASADSSGLLAQLLRQHPAYFEPYINDKERYKVQIIFTQIDRRANNKPVFTDHFFNVNDADYFYPASTVKMPVALFALEEINKLRQSGVTRGSSMITEAAYSGQTPVYNDPASPDGRPTVEHYIKKIFLVSDNDAFNRLYEFVGQEQINKRLQEMGYDDAAIVHRLSIPLSDDENRHTNPIKFYDDTARLLHTQSMRHNVKPYPARKDFLGRGYYSRGNLIMQPMDFSRKNKLTLSSLHLMLRGILFPDAMPKHQRFDVSDEDLRFVWKYMSMYPGESEFPLYKTDEYHDAYCKFLYWGFEKGSLPKNLRIFNKVGDAYGFLTDVAYVVDFDKNIEFMVSATIYCNSDGILNDDHYDYATVGFPFLKHLGRVLYEHELKRAKKREPELTGFKF
ncbi:MAG TPA: serine hydrolase [Chitinophagaceae bacterium]|nr:serine hydrolase [Chitinophagaceae bacterium]